MNIAYQTLGKLSLPVALAVESKGHDVVGYDINPSIANIINNRVLPYKEEDVPELLSKSNIKFVNLAKVVEHGDIIFSAPQTPHQPLYEGITRLPKSRENFDYSYLKEAMISLSKEIDRQGQKKIVVIISTTIPGAIEREIKPILSPLVRLVYNPAFIAMGTTVRDYLNPEFVLMGVDDIEAAEIVKDFYKTLHSSPIFETTIDNAELIKVAYNTYIGMKIVFANTMMEICHKTNADVDTITDALSLATDRLISTKYMRGGMGDGGYCHPRDQIALSWLAQHLELSHDFFEDLMIAREDQTVWLADLIIEIQERYDNLEVMILGKAFKPETNLIGGSPAILLKNIMAEDLEPLIYDPHVDKISVVLTRPRIYFIATKHDIFTAYDFPEGSVVIDPWRYIPDQEGVEVIRIGEGPKTLARVTN